MQNLMTKTVSIDPAGVAHESFSYEPVAFVLFGQRKGDGWVSLASADTYAGIESAKTAIEGRFRRGWSYAIVQAVTA